MDNGFGYYLGTIDWETDINFNLSDTETKENLLDVSVSYHNLTDPLNLLSFSVLKVVTLQISIQQTKEHNLQLISKHPESLFVQF